MVNPNAATPILTLTPALTLSLTQTLTCCSQPIRSARGVGRKYFRGEGRTNLCSAPTANPTPSPTGQLRTDFNISWKASTNTGKGRQEAPAPSVYAPAVGKLWSVVTSATLHETNSCRCAEVAVTVSARPMWNSPLYCRPKPPNIAYRNTSTNPIPNLHVIDLDTVRRLLLHCLKSLCQHQPKDCQVPQSCAK